MKKNRGTTVCGTKVSYDHDDDSIHNDEDDEKGGLCLNEYRYVRAKIQFFDQQEYDLEVIS